MAQQRKRQPLRLVIVLALVAAATSALTVLFYYSYTIYTIVERPILLTVDAITGVNLDADTITFGTIMPGTRAERKITLAATRDTAITLDIRGITLVTAEPSELFIKNNTNATVTLTAAIPEHTPYGAYNGTLRVTSRRPL